MRPAIALWLRSPRLPTWRRLAAAGAVLALVGLTAVGLAQASVQTSVASFLPADDPAATELARVGEAFGGDPVVVLLETQKNRDLFTPSQLSRVLKLEGTLARLPDVVSVSGPATTLNQIAGRAQDFVAELAGRRDGVRAHAVAEARKAGANGPAAEAAGTRALEKFDARYGRLLIKAMPSGMPTLNNQRFVNSVVYDRSGKPRPQWRFVVPSQDSVAILIRPRQDADADAISQVIERTRHSVHDAGLKAARVTISGVPAVAAALGSAVTGEILLIGGLAVIGVACCLLVVPWTRWRRRLLPLATTLAAVAVTVSCFGWLDRPLSLGVIAFLSVLLGVGSYYATYMAHRVSTRTVAVVATGTAASFATLALSPLPFVRDLGLTLSAGVLVSTLIGWVIMRAVASQSAAAWVPPNEKPTSVGLFHAAAGKWSVGAAAVLVACAGWAVFPAISVQSDVSRLAGGLPALAEADHAAKVLRSTGELRIVLHGRDVLTPEGFRWMRNAQQRLIQEHGDELRPALSLPTLMSFLGPNPTAGQIRAGARLLPPYLVGSAVRQDRTMAVLTFGINTNDISRIRQIRDDVTATLPPPPRACRAQVTGIPIIGVRANELVSEGRIWVNLIGIVAAATVLALGLRTRWDALRAAVAAALATGAGFLLLWSTGVPLNPITVALGSLTSAVACEFTVLLATAVRQGNGALRRAVVLAAAASTTGYVVLVVSQIALIREFGVLLGATVLLALAASATVVAISVNGPSGGSSIVRNELDGKKDRRSTHALSGAR